MQFHVILDRVIPEPGGYLNIKYKYRDPHVNTLRPRQMAAIFQTTFFKCIFLNENVLISIKISLKFVPKGQINNIPAFV